MGRSPADAPRGEKMKVSLMKGPGTGAPADVTGRVLENRFRRAAMRFGLATALVTFFVSSSAILLDQWISGQVPPFFMLGTMLVLLGFSVGLFGAIVGIGLVVSVFAGPADAAARRIADDVSQLTDSSGHRPLTGVTHGVEN
jgi:hypothetical protein